jgi:hypothetical protein
MSDRQGVEIDYCPNCRGVWLDRGELDKIIERSDAYMNQQGQGDQKQYPQQGNPFDRTYPKQGDKYYDPNYKHKKKKGFLDDFFDF